MAEMKRDIPTADEMDDFIELLTGDAYWNETHEDGSPSSLCRDAMRSALAIWLEEHPRESAGRAAWTKEPKEGGWYWYRKPYGNPLLCYLQPATSRRFQFIAHGSGAAVYDVMPEGAEFLGPLRPLASGEERDEERARKAAEACAKWFAEGCVPANARGFESGLADEFYRRILAALSGEEGRRG